MGKITITRKVEIFVNEKDNDQRKNFYKQLRDYEYHTFKYANQIVQLNYLKDILRTGLGAGKNIITPKEISEKVSTIFECSERNIGYKFINEETYNILPSIIRSTLNSVIHKNYNSDKKDVLCGRKSIRNYRRGIPIPFQSATINNLKKLDNNKNYTFTIFGTRKTPGIPMSTRLGRDKSDNETILDRIASGEYKMCDSSIQFKKNKLFFLMVVKIPKEIAELDENKTLGIDLGLNIPLYASVNTTNESLAIGSRENFLNQRLTLKRRKKDLQRNLRFNTGGRGRKQKMKALDRLNTTENNWVTTYNHKLSKQVIEFALKTKCKTINIEDLKGIGDNINTFVLSNWSYFQLQQFITDKAKKYGITVNKVTPKYSSQRCFECGHIDRDNRKTQEHFECTNCGHKDNADHNAAKNISIANTKEYKKLIKKHSDSKTILVD